MKQELERSTKEISDLKQEVLSKSLTREAFENDEDKVHFYTGLPNFVTLLTIFNLLEPFITVNARSSLDKFQQFLVFNNFKDIFKHFRHCIQSTIILC